MLIIVIAVVFTKGREGDILVSWPHGTLNMTLHAQISELKQT